MNKSALKMIPLVVALAAVVAPAQAFEAGDVLVKVGVHAVDPKSGNGNLAGGAFAAEVDSNVKPSLQVEYFLSPNIGVELLASAPFSHKVELNGAKAASFNHLPPTLSLQYHFGDQRIKPFIGAGINWVWTFDEKSTGPLAGTEVGIGNSWGVAFHGGIDYELNNGWYVGADLRWIDVDANVSVNGAQVGNVHVDPLTYGAYIGWKF
ncbi:MAG: OmpW family protein [Lysobacterales bacterium]